MKISGRDLIVLVIAGEIAPADLHGLYERFRLLLAASGARVVVCDVGGLVTPDAAAVDALARLQLLVRRCGRRLVFIHGSEALRDLLALMGLSDILRLEPRLRLEPERQPKEREQRSGVQEEGDPADPIP